MTIISSMGGCGSTSFISWFGQRLKCNCPVNSEGLPAAGPGSNAKGLKHRQRPPQDSDRYLPSEEHIERAVFFYDSPYNIIPSLFRRRIAVGHAIAITGKNPGHNNDLDKFLQAGVDSFGFEEQFASWSDCPIKSSYPILIVRASTIWSHLLEIFEFLEIPKSEMALFPLKAKRQSSFDHLQPAQKAALAAIYGTFADRVNSLPDIVRIDSPKKSLSSVRHPGSNSGLLYFCAGSTSYLRQAVQSALSAREIHPNLQIGLIHSYGDGDLMGCDLSVFCKVEHVRVDTALPPKFEGPMLPFLSKIQALQQTPFDRTIFLDCDTRVCSPLTDMFDLLNRFDMALAPGPIAQKPRVVHDVMHSVPNCFPELNTGVIVYRINSRVRSFLEKWKTAFRDNENDLFREHGKGGEQVALRYLLWSTPEIAIHVLSCNGVPNLFNYRWPLGTSFKFDHSIKIHHHFSVGTQGGDGEGKIAGTSRVSKPSALQHRGILSYGECLEAFEKHCEARKEDFFFVQVGANDGNSYDPITRHVRKYGWKGILVEPVEHLFLRLLSTYAGVPGLIFEKAAIGLSEGQVPFYFFPEVLERDKEFPPWAKGMGSILPPFNSAGHQTLQHRGFKPEKIMVQSITMASLIERHKVKNIDMLQIDAEGFDGEIIQSIDFGKCRPRFIQYENRHIQTIYEQGLSKYDSSSIKVRLTAAGYKVFSVGNGFDNFCLRVED